MLSSFPFMLCISLVFSYSYSINNKVKLADYYNAIIVLY